MPAKDESALAGEPKHTSRRALLRNLLGGAVGVWAASGAVDAQASQGDPPPPAAGTIYDVTQFGARGDGHTDDTASIQRALDAVRASGGGAVYFPVPPVAYWVTSSLTIHSNTVVRGAGWGAQIAMGGAWTGTNGLFLADPGASNVIVEDLRIDCLKASKAGTTLSRGLYIQNASQVKVRRLQVIDPGHAGILIDGGADIDVTDCLVSGGGNGSQAATAGGIEVSTGGGPTHNVTITGNIIDRTTDTGIGVFANARDVTIAGNTIVCVGLPGVGGHSIDLPGCQQVTVSGNMIDCGTTADGIYIHSYLDRYDVSDITVTGNTVVGPGQPLTGNGINISATNANPAARLNVSGNTVKGMASCGLIACCALTDSVLSDNIFQACGSHGMQVDNAGLGLLSAVVVSGNMCTQNRGFGLYLHPNLSGCKFIGNTCRGNVAGATNATDTVRWNNSWAFNGDSSSLPEQVAYFSQWFAGLSYPNKLTVGSGMPGVFVNGQPPNNGDFYLRTDTPGMPNQRIYVYNSGWWGIA